MSRVGHEQQHFVYNSNSYPGDSGGAILLKKGKVIGMHVVRVVDALRLFHVQHMRGMSKMLVFCLVT